MPNKYKKYALKKDARVGEIVKTYGVEFVNNPEHKPHMHNQNRPYLIIHREESGKFLALKLSSKIRGYMSEFKIFPSKYSENQILTKTSVADMRYITELEPQDITENGFVLDENDLNNLYGKILRLYSINETNISDEHAKIIFQYYIKNRKIVPGTVIKIKYCENYLLVLKENENDYTCLPLYRSKTEFTHDEINVLNNHPSYVDYDEDYSVPKEETCFIMSFYTDEQVMNHVFGRINSRKRYYKLKEQKNTQ